MLAPANYPRTQNTTEVVGNVISFAGIQPQNKVLAKLKLWPGGGVRLNVKDHHSYRKLSCGGQESVY